VREMIEKKQILDKRKIAIIVERLVQQLIENHQDFSNTILVGVQPRGIFLGARIVTQLKKIIKDNNIKYGSLDIAFYRDDFRRREHPIVPQEIDMNFSVEGKRVVLIDDVLYTGRSIRSAIDALMALGRPQSVELLTLIDRRYSRELPIQPNYVGKTVDTIEAEKVIVQWKETEGEDKVIMLKSEE